MGAALGEKEEEKKAKGPKDMVTQSQAKALKKEGYKLIGGAFGRETLSLDEAPIKGKRRLLQALPSTASRPTSAWRRRLRWLVPINVFFVGDITRIPVATVWKSKLGYHAVNLHAIDNSSQ